MIQHDVRAVGEIDIDELSIQCLALRDVGDAAGACQQIVEFRIAVFPPIQEAVAGEPDRNVAVRVRPLQITTIAL